MVSNIATIRGRARLILSCVAILALACGLVLGQETTGSIAGSVLDASGAAIPNAKVEITGASLPRAITLTTGADGTYTAQQVPAGTYLVSAVANGFATSKRTDVSVVLGRTARIDFRMEVGQVSESVVVSADAVMVDTTSSSSAVTVDKSFFDLIPKGRSFYALINLAPGARDEGKAGGYQVDGASGSENTYYLDGMEVTSIQQGTLSDRNKVPVEMIQQVQVKNGVMEAQYGGAMGGVVNAVIRSGTNQFHGEVGFYFNNDAMSARPRPTLQLDPLAADDNSIRYFQNQNDSFKTWNPIFNFGGPLIKDKLFFFAGYMPTRTNLERTVHFNSGETGTYSRQETQQYLTTKLDFVPHNKLRTNVSWVYNPYKVTSYLPARDGTDEYGSPWAGRGERTAGNILGGQVDYLATNKLVLSLRGGYNYTNFTNAYGVPLTASVYYSGSPLSLPGIPDNLRAPAGWVVQAAGLTAHDTYSRINLNADATYIFNAAGQHNIKGGWQMNKLANDVIRNDYAGGYYRYFWGNTYRCVTTQCSGQQKGEFGYYRYRELGATGDVSSSNQGLFLQDNWKVSKRLTLNLGLRTEREFLPSFSTGSNIPSQAITFNFPDKISPRIGFALDPTGTGKMRLYGSIGWFYDVMKYELPRGSFGGEVWKDYFYNLDDPTLVTKNNRVPTDPKGLPGKFLEVIDYRVPSNDPADNRIDPNLKPMKQRMFDLGYDYSINPSLVASLRYTNRRLIRTIEDIGTLEPDGENYYIGNPGYGVVADPKTWLPGIPVTPKARRDYDAVEVRLDKRFSSHYQYAASYTYSRSYGNYSGLASSDENGRTSPNVNRYFDLPWIGYTEKGQFAEGRLATDRPHTFKLFGAYSQNSKLGTTTLSPNIQLYSGTPLTTTVDVQSGGVPMFVYGRGDLGRTPFFHNFDLNLMHDFKPFKNHEAWRTRFEFTVFNLFNSSIVTDKNVAMQHPNDGQLQFDSEADIFKGFNAKSLMANQDIRTNPMYGLASGFQSPRSLRLQLSFQF